MRTLTVLCAAALAALAVACQKDDNTVDLAAYVADEYGGNAKVSIDENRYACWETGDAVNVNGTNYTAAVEGDLKHATIAGVTASDAGYTAVYPASCAASVVAGSSTVTLTLPDVQTWDADHIFSPMVATYSNNQLNFHNPCNLLAVTVTNNTGSALQIHQIVMTATTSILCGTATVADCNTETPYVSAIADGSKDLTLDCGNTEIAAGGNYTFYVSVPGVSNEHFRFRVLAENGDTKYTFDVNSNASGITLTQNQLVPVPVELDGTTSNSTKTFWGQGTEDDPFLITCYDDLEAFRTLVKAGTNTTYVKNNNVYYRQTCDIDASSTTWNCSGGRFFGHYDGGNHYIKLSLSLSNGGLFGYLYGATIENLTLNGASVSGSSATTFGTFCNSALYDASANEYTTLRNCTNNISVTSTSSSTTSSYLGGIVGLVNASTKVQMINCTNNGTITGNKNSTATTYYIGGLAGWYKGRISDCTNNSNVSGANNVGGFVGRYNGWVSFNGTCTNHGDISGKQYVGGFIGCATPEFTITGTMVNKGDITGTMYVGGVVGQVASGASNPINISGDIVNEGSVTGTGGYVGGIVGQTNSASACNISGATNKGAIQGTYDVGGIVGYTLGVGTVSNCYNSGTVRATGTGTDMGLGGIVGIVYSGTRTVENCRNTGNVTADAGNNTLYAGGIIGLVRTGTTTVNNCAVNGVTITVNKCFGAAGIVGANKGGVNIYNSYFNGTITTIGASTYAVGGITTSNNTGTINITNCYVNIDLGTDNAGLNYATGFGSMAFRYTGKGTVTVTNSYANISTTKGSYAHSATTTFNISTGELAAAQTVNGESCTTLYSALHNWYLAHSTYSDWKNETIPTLSWED